MSSDNLTKLDLELKLKMIQWRKEIGISNYYEKIAPYVYDAIANGITYIDGKTYKII